jgi:hypothetical protein
MKSAHQARKAEKQADEKSAYKFLCFVIDIDN